MTAAGRFSGWIWPARPDIGWYDDIKIVEPPTVNQALSNKRRTVYNFLDV
jgi:hypothetical protein